MGRGRIPRLREGVAMASDIPDPSSPEFKMENAIIREDTTGLIWALSDRLIDTGTAFISFEKQVRASQAQGNVFPPVVERLLEDPMLKAINEYLGRFRGKCFLYTEREEPSELLGSLKTWNARTLPFEHEMEAQPDYHTAIFELDASTRIYERGLPEPDKVQLFMSWGLEGDNNFKERQIVVFNDWRAQLKDFEFHDKVSVPHLDWRDMTEGEGKALADDLADLHDRIYAKLQDLAQGVAGLSD